MTNKQLPYIICAIILIVMVAVAVVFVHLPLSKKMSQEKQELEQKKTQLSIVQRKVKELNKLRQSIGKLEEETIRLQNKIPDKPNIPNVVDYLESYADECGVIVKSVQFNVPQQVTPQPQQTSGTASEQNTEASANAANPSSSSNININICSLKIKGQYPSIIRFFNQVKSSPRLFSIKDIKISPENDDGKEIDVELSLVYFNYFGAQSVGKLTENKG